MILDDISWYCAASWHNEFVLFGTAQFHDTRCWSSHAMFWVGCLPGFYGLEGQFRFIYDMYFYTCKLWWSNQLCIRYTPAIYHIYGLVFRVPTPPWYGSPGSTPFPSICELLAQFLRSSPVFARSLQHFWLPASHLLGTCYLLDDLRSSTHTPSKYLLATYSHICMCYVSTSYVLPVSHNTTCV